MDGQGFKLLVYTNALLQQMPVLLFIVVQRSTEPVSLPTQKTVMTVVFIYKVVP